jgi:hypothetical protein
MQLKYEGVLEPDDIRGVIRCRFGGGWVGTLFTPDDRPYAPTVLPDLPTRWHGKMFVIDDPDCTWKPARLHPAKMFGLGP